MCNLRLVWFKGSEYSNAVSHPFPVTPLRAELKKTNIISFRKVQFSHSVVSSSLQPHGLQHARPPCPPPTPGVYPNSRPIKSVMPSNYLIFCCPLLFLLSIFPSIRVFSNESVLCISIRVFSNESVFCIRWPKYQSFSFSISPSNEYSGLISFRVVGSPCSPRES